MAVKDRNKVKEAKKVAKGPEWKTCEFQTGVRYIRRVETPCFCPRKARKGGMCDRHGGLTTA